MGAQRGIIRSTTPMKRMRSHFSVMLRYRMPRVWQIEFAWYAELQSTMIDFLKLQSESKSPVLRSSALI